jgi:hypothetical protein
MIIRGRIENSVSMEGRKQDRNAGRRRAGRET